MAQAPPWATEPDINDPHDAERVAEWAAMSPDQRLEYFIQACRLAMEVLNERADATDLLEQRAPMSPESEANWLRMVAEARRNRVAR